MSHHAHGHDDAGRVSALVHGNHARLLLFGFFRRYAAPFTVKTTSEGSFLKLRGKKTENDQKKD
jgi:hypothetical protein